MSETIEERQQEAQRNRAALPETARIVDEFRRVFGAEVKLLYAREGDIEMGMKSRGAAW